MACSHSTYRPTFNLNNNVSCSGGIQPFGRGLPAPAPIPALDPEMICDMLTDYEKGLINSFIAMVTCCGKNEELAKWLRDNACLFWVASGQAFNICTPEVRLLLFQRDLLVAAIAYWAQFIDQWRLDYNRKEGRVEREQSAGNHHKMMDEQGSSQFKSQDTETAQMSFAKQTVHTYFYDTGYDQSGDDGWWRKRDTVITDDSQYNDQNQFDMEATKGWLGSGSRGRSKRVNKNISKIEDHTRFKTDTYEGTSLTFLQFNASMGAPIGGGSIGFSASGTAYGHTDAAGETTDETCDEGVQFDKTEEFGDLDIILPDGSINPDPYTYFATSKTVQDKQGGSSTDLGFADIDRIFDLIDEEFGGEHTRDDISAWTEQGRNHTGNAMEHKEYHDYGWSHYEDQNTHHSNHAMHHSGNGADDDDRTQNLVIIERKYSQIAENLSRLLDTTLKDLKDIFKVIGAYGGYGWARIAAPRHHHCSPPRMSHFTIGSSSTTCLPNSPYGGGRTLGGGYG